MPLQLHLAQHIQRVFLLPRHGPRVVAQAQPTRIQEMEFRLVDLATQTGHGVREEGRDRRRECRGNVARGQDLIFGVAARGFGEGLVDGFDAVVERGEELYEALGADGGVAVGAFEGAPELFERVVGGFVDAFWEEELLEVAAVGFEKYAGGGCEEEE